MNHIIYEDDVFIAYLSPTPNVVGHTILQPKEKFPIFEAVPNQIVGKMFFLANQLSAILFETLGIEGTNILIQNGTAAGQKDPHVQVHIIPRKQEDGVKLDWEPKKLNKDDMEIVTIKLKNALSGKVVTGKNEEVQKKPTEEPVSEKEYYRLG